jgi:hypothetical protein
MANNRMWLVHPLSKEAILLAKYYPTTGWYMMHSQEVVDDWLHGHNDTTMWGDTSFCIKYEQDDRFFNILDSDITLPLNKPKDVA